ncbi:MAG: hypothetical protein GVY04_21995 [Cyanobacteria bacterium]|nr:hypothetical protein [Cyanobacteria bacterium GSL.Bin1]
MYFYQAYRLRIYSALPLPELVAHSGDKPDVVIQFGELMPPPTTEETRNHHYWLAGQDIYLFWRELGTFRVREGREIMIDPAPNIKEVRLRPPILGACMAVLLHQRGDLVLHASAVQLPTGVVAFLGDKGWGKSTMAAVLHQRGHPFVTDDILAVALNSSSQPLVFPAFPQMKLWPSAVVALGEDPETLPRLIPQLTKRQHRVAMTASQTPMPLQAIYLLGQGPSLKIAPLASPEIFAALLRHSYGGRFGKALLQHGEASHFQQCMTLAQQVPTYQLQRPSDLSLLPTIAEAVEGHGRESATN